MPTGNTQQIIDYGTTPNDGTGDPLRTAFIKTDENFDNVWLAGPVGSNVRINNNTISSIDTNGNITIKPDGVGIIQANASILPNATNTRDLGSANLVWRRLYVGTLATTDMTVDGELTVTGNLTVDGDIVQIGNLVTDAKTIQLANTASTDAAADGSGITVGASDDIATLLYNSTDNEWRTNIGANISGNVTADYFIGDGSQLTGISLVGNSLVNGNSNVVVVSNGNVEISANGSPNILTVVHANLGWNTTQLSQVLVEGSLRSTIGLRSPSLAARANIYTNTDDGVISGGSLSLNTVGVGNGAMTAATGSFTGNLAAGNLSISANASIAQNIYTKTGTFSGDSRGENSIYAGFPTFTSLGSDVIAQFSGNVDSYTQFNFQNAGDGTQASGDFVITADNGDDTTHFINIGLTSSNWDGTQPNSLNSRLGPNDGYMYVQDGNLTIGTKNGNNASSLWRFDTTGNVTATSNLIPSANGVYSLGNSTNYWSNIWVASNTIYIGGVALGVTGNVLTVDGEPVLSNDSDSSITTTGNITANYFIGDGSQLTGLSDGTAIVNGTSQIDIPTANGNIYVGVNNVGSTEFTALGINTLTLAALANITAAGTITANGNLSAGNISTAGTITATDQIRGGFFSIYNPDYYGDLGFSGDDLAITANVALNIYTDYFASGESAPLWTFGTDGTLTTPGDITVGGDITGIASANTLVLRAQPTTDTYIQLNSIVDSTIQTFANLDIVTDSSNTSQTWSFGTDGVLTLPNGGEIDNDGNNIELRSSNNINFEATSDLNIYTDNGSSQWTFGSGNTLTLPGGTAVIDSSDDNIELRSNNNINMEAVGVVNVYTDNGNNQWQFGDDGVLSLSDTGQTVLYLDQFGIRANTQMTLSAENFATGNNSSILFDKNGGGIVFRLENNTPSQAFWGFYQGNVTFPDGSVQTSAYGNANATSLLAAFGSNTISTTGNITAANFIGNVSLTGNITGTSANVELVAGSYTFTFDNTGVATFPAIGGDEGGEIHLGVPAANTTLQNTVKIDVYQDRIRFFEGSANAKGAYIDIANCADGVGTALGYLNIPQITLSANTTAALADSGKHFYSTTAGDLAILIPTNANVAFPTGTAFTIVVQAAGNVLVNADTGVTLYMAGSNSTGNRAVGAYGMATVMKVASDTWFINGTGVY